MEYKKTVLEKLDRIDELFPPERLARSRERWRRLWLGEELLDRLPFTYSPIALGYWDITPKEQRLMDSLDEFIARGIMDDDFIPGLFAGCHQGAMASLFGARTYEVFNEDVMDTNCEQLFLALEDAAALQPPAMLPESIPARWIAMNVPLSTLLLHLESASTKGAPPIAQPTRQPVMLKVFESECISMATSFAPGTSRMLCGR